MCDADAGQTEEDTLLVLKDLEMQKQIAVAEEDCARCQLLQKQIARARNCMGRMAARVAMTFANALVLSGSALPLGTDATELASSVDGEDGTRGQPPGAKASPEGREETPSNQLQLEASQGLLNSLQGGSGEPGSAHDAPGSSPVILARDVMDVAAERGGDEPVIGAELKNPPSVN